MEIASPTERPEPISPIGAISDATPKLPRAPKKTNQFTTAPDLDLFRLTKELRSNSRDIPHTGIKSQLEYAVGHAETFWLMDISNAQAYQSNFTLVLTTPHAYWYVEDNLDFNKIGLKRSATHFEENIYPTITQIFGTEWIPGIDNNHRLSILNAQLKNVAGYFSSTDEYPVTVRPRSNQREIIYINAHDISPGTMNYDMVLSHELQHAIHWNADASEDTWVNEGLSELASSIALGSTFSIGEFMRAGPVSLVNWPTSSDNSLVNYGASSLFMHFFTEHYASRADLRDFLNQPKDNIRGIDQYLTEQGYEESFEDVFRQWAAANILDRNVPGNEKLLGYDKLEIKMEISEKISGLKQNQSEIPQYAVEYTEVNDISQPFLLYFQGNKDVALLPVDVGSTGCWWSNSGDSIDSTLSRRIETPVGSIAVLEYEVWFEIEEGWDYLYVEFSVDNGENWQIIETPRTSPANPIGNAFGPGYSGKSDGWVSESVKLTPIAGQDLWVRFQYVTDDAINGAGACLRNISITAAAKRINDGWEPRGFAFTDNIIRQDFQVQLITIGEQPQVRQLILDSDNSGVWTLQPLKNDERVVVAVGSLAEKTRELANYSISLTPTK